MKKTLSIVIVIILACVLVTGLFSAGLVVGRFLLPSGGDTPIAEELVDIPVINEIEIDTPQAESPMQESPTEEPIQGDTLPPQTTNIPEPPSNLEDLFIPFWEAWDIVHENYVDQPVDDEAMMAGAIQGMLLAIDDTASVSAALSIDADEYISESGTPKDLHDLFTPFWQSWTLAHAPDDTALVQGAISGMLDSLGDQHTSYMNPDQYVQANIPLDGTYEGIGAWVDPNREYLTIVSPMPGSPAEEVGLMPGDEIVAVDGEDMTGIDGNLVIRRVLGPADSKVVLTIRRTGVEHLFDVEITRAKITIPSVEYRMLDKNIGYIHILTFGDDTTIQLRSALEELIAEDPVGLVVDFRNNGGGYVSSAIEVTSEFIGEGVVLIEDYGEGEREVYDALDGGLATEIPMVVLVNDGTASASEIVTGAIQDYGRAPLVGTTTFGKGSVQSWIPLSTRLAWSQITPLQS
jgi:carboxyl-terminal processing protease